MRCLYSTLSDPLRRLVLRIEAPLAAFIITTAVLVTDSVLVNGPKMRASSEAAIKADIEQEDHTVCAELGFSSGHAFNACSDALAGVRQRQEGRMAGYSFW